MFGAPLKPYELRDRLGRGGLAIDALHDVLPDDFDEDEIEVAREVAY
jgi:hypothetical protein